MNLNIKYMDVDELVSYAGNAKEHPGWQVDQIIESIEEFGFCDPVAVWTNAEGVCEIIEGHGRILALKEMGESKVPVIKLDHLSDEQRRAYVHVHNQLTMNTGFSLDILQEELDKIETIDMGKFGFDISELTVGDYTDIIEDTPPEVGAAATRCKSGDVWQLGPHRLMCGDSTKTEAVAKLVDGAEVDLLITDPPYNVAYEGGTADKLTIQNDDMSDAEFKALLEGSFEAAETVMKPGAAFYIWHASRTQRQFEDALNRVGFEVRQQLVWVKNNLTLGRQDYQWRHEPCFYGWKPGAPHHWFSDRKQTTVYEDEFERDIRSMKKDELVDYCQTLLDALHEFKETVLRFDKPSRNAEHPTMKPVKLIAYLIENSSKRGEAVLDVFGGSGSTLIACEQLDRTCYTMELDPHYCDVIIERWENLTGEEAVKL